MPCTKTEGGRNGREVLDAGAEAHVPEDGEAAEDLGCEYGSQGTVRCKVLVTNLGGLILSSVETDFGSSKKYLILQSQKIKLYDLLCIFLRG